MVERPRRAAGMAEGESRFRRGREAHRRGKEQGEGDSAQAREAARAGALSRKHLLRGSELHRSHGRDGARARTSSRAEHEGAGREAVALREDFEELGGRAGREGQAAGVRAEGGLGGRAGRRDRQGGEGRERGEGARLRGGLHDRQRPLGARRDAARQESAELAVPLRLGQPEMLRRRLPARAVDRSGERDPRSAPARHQALGERRADAGFAHQQDDLRHRGADRDAVLAREAIKEYEQEKR